MAVPSIPKECLLKQYFSTLPFLFLNTLFASLAGETMDDEESDSIDRISELPDPLALSILSLLPMRDAVATTFLSKRWNNLWTTVPCLHFFAADLCIDEFREFVSGALAFWKGTKILRFTLVMFDLSLTNTFLDSWLLFAIDKQVEELHLDPIYRGDFEFNISIKYSPPQLLYSCSSITKLTLVSCRLEIEKNVQWDQLKSLTIKGDDPLGGNAVEQILSGAPRLEVLNLDITDANNYCLNIQSSSLKMLNIDMHRNFNSGESNDSVLRIWCPNLEILGIWGVPYRRCLLKVPSLTKASLDFYKRDSGQYSGDALVEEMLWHVIQSVQYVKEITLSYLCIKILLEMMKKDKLVSFPNAKYLKFYPNAADEIAGIVEMFPELMVLVVELNNLDGLLCSDLHVSLWPGNPSALASKSFKPLEVSVCPQLAHLRRVEISWYMPDTSIFGVIEMILENAEMLEKIVYQPANSVNYQELHMVEEKLASMRRSSPTAELIIKEWHW